MKFITLLLLLVGHLQAYGQGSSELPYLIIPPHELPERFKEFEKQQIQKVVLKGCAKQRGYQVIIGDPPSHKKTRWLMYRVDLDVKWNESLREFRVHASLVDARNNKVFNSITEVKIPELEFYRRLEVIIDRLFLPPVIDIESPPLEIDVKEVITRKKAEIIPAVPESQTANLNFRERIMDMKKEVNFAVANANRVNREGKKLDPGKDADSKKKNPPKTIKAEAAEMVNNPLNVDPSKLKKPPPPIDVGHSIRVGYYTFTTNSDHLVNTTSNPKYLLVDYEYARPWKRDSDFYHHINLRYGKNLNKEVKEFSPYTGFGFWEGYNFSNLSWMPKLGLEMDTISFSNLPINGEGLKLANNQIFWATVSSVNNFSIRKKPFRFSLSYGKPLKVITNYEALDGKSLTGSKINITFAALNIYRKFHLEVNYFTSSLAADTPIEGLTFDTTGVGFNAFYNF